MNRQVVVVEPGAGQKLGNVEFLARSVDTPYFNLGIVTLAPGQGVPAHVHTDEDDSFLVLQGILTVTVGDEATVLSVPAGTYVLVPSGTRHEFVNASDTDVRMLNLHAPGGFDRRLGLPEQDLAVSGS